MITTRHILGLSLLDVQPGFDQSHRSRDLPLFFPLVASFTSLIFKKKEKKKKTVVYLRFMVQFRG